MNSKRIVSKLVASSVGLVIIAFSTQVLAEYYVAYPVPVAVGCCDTPRVVKYVKAKVYKRPHYRVHKRYKKHRHVIHRPRNCYSVAKYHAWILPAPCSQWVVSCEPVWQVRGCGGYKVHRERVTYTERYIVDEPIDQRATADDIYPELNIDN